MDLAAAGDRQGVRVHPLSKHGLRAIRRIRHDPLAAVLAGVQPAIGAEHQSIRGADVFLEDADLAVDGDFVNPVVGDVCEENIPLPVDRRSRLWNGGNMVVRDEARCPFCLLLFAFCLLIFS